MPEGLLKDIYHFRTMYHFFPVGSRDRETGINYFMHIWFLRSLLNSSEWHNDHASACSLVTNTNHLHTFKLLNSELHISNKPGNNLCKAEKQLQCSIGSDERADLRSWGVPSDHTMLAWWWMCPCIDSALENQYSSNWNSIGSYWSAALNQNEEALIHLSRTAPCPVMTHYQF